MCGICGIIRKRQGAGEVSAAQLSAMLPALAARGPDDEGIHCENGFGFGHRRLSIIDLSPQGRQPMLDHDLQLVITYNGEIYNYSELQQELKQRGYRFNSNSDTEVILKAYACWGENFVQKFNGMFAFCLYDRRRDRFILARDRLGIKPLYYTEKEGDFYFASNIQSLAAATNVCGEISVEALHYYLSFHSVVPAPLTIFKQIYKLEPGALMIIEGNGAKHQKTYWSVNHLYDQKETLPEEEWRQRILDLLTGSVRYRLVSDLPVGAFLSGGLDSSLVVALMSRLSESRLKTYSIGFEDVAGTAGNEFYFSDLIAAKFGTDHQKIFIQSEALLDAVRQSLQAMSEPMASHDAVGFFLLSREVSKETRVVLCGQGADEVFAGYHWYPTILYGRGDPAALYRRSFFDRSDAEIRETLHPDYHPDRDYSYEFVKRHFALPGATSPLDKALRLDTTVMLVEDPVKRVDNMTMAFGLEARVPFLDYRMVELAARLAPELKIKGGGKYILKKAAQQLLPREIICRHKGYFPVPALKHLQGAFLDFAREILFSQQAQQRGLIRRSYLEQAFARPEREITVLGGNKLWQLAVLEYWLQTSATCAPAVF